MRRSTSLTIALALVLASLTLTACGSSSGSNSTQTTGSAEGTTAGGTASTSTGAATETTGTTGTTGGSTDSKTTSTTGTGTAKSGALKQALAGYEACMREHGVQVPLRTRGSSASSAEVQARKQALSACRPVLRAALHTLAHNERHTNTTPASPTNTGSAGSGTGSTGATSSTSSTPTPTSTVPHIKPAATPAPVTAALKHFTACMHEHGITNFPEPEGASFNVSHVSLDRSSTQFKAAEKACNPILQAIG